MAYPCGGRTGMPNPISRALSNQRLHGGACGSSIGTGDLHLVRATRGPTGLRSPGCKFVIERSFASFFNLDKTGAVTLCSMF